MPLYEYQCPNCGDHFEELVSASRLDAPPCPKCGGKKSQRVLSAPAACPGSGKGAGSAGASCGSGGFS